MTAMRLLGTMMIALGLAAPATAQSKAASPAPSAAGSAGSAAPTVRTLPITNRPWTGDFDRLLERRMIRVLVPFSRTLYFNDRGRERGLTGELVRDFEQHVNRKYKTGNRPLTVYIVPTTRDELLSQLEAGQGDLAAGNLTITEARLKRVDFTPLPLEQSVSEVVLTGPKSPSVASVDDLSGKTVHVRKSSSYFENLTALNAPLAQTGKPPVTLVPVPDALEEDMMEMLNAGLLQLIVVDDWKAKLWAQVLPNVHVQTKTAVHEGGRLGWALRKDSPKLGAALTEFFALAVKMPTTGAELGVGDIKVAESNIHAGAKYMDRLMTRHFQDADFTEGNRTLFAFASYNAGPGNISKARKEAAKRGLDPNRWFNNVEVVVAEKIGREPTTYVRNIYK